LKGTARIHEFEQGLGWKVQLKFTSLNKDLVERYS